MLSIEDTVFSMKGHRYRSSVSFLASGTKSHALQRCGSQVSGPLSTIGLSACACADQDDEAHRAGEGMSFCGADAEGPEGGSGERSDGAWLCGLPVHSRHLFGRGQYS